jgi:hypothetical protein
VKLQEETDELSLPIDSRTLPHLSIQSTSQAVETADSCRAAIDLFFSEFSIAEKVDLRYKMFW